MWRLRIIGPARVTASQRAQAFQLAQRIPGCSADPLTPLNRRQLWVAVGRRAVVGFATWGEACDAQGRTVRAWLLSSGVAPEARGHAIQCLLIRAGLAAMRATARRQGIPFVAETFAVLGNAASRANIEAAGFEHARDSSTFAHYHISVGA